MQLFKACFEILGQLTSTVHQIRPDDFSKPSVTLGGSTIGQHLRHTLEFFICLEQGFDQGIINYDKREHDRGIESDKLMALEAIARIRTFISGTADDRSLQLQVGYEKHSDDFITLSTNYYRELTYNIEHAVHHMAIIKIGVGELAPYIQLPEHFGIAVSTVRYQEAVVLQPQP